MIEPAVTAAPRGVRSVIAVGGGRGGAGKSVLAVNLAVYLAQLGRSVVLVDADPAGAELHTMLGLEQPRGPDEADEAGLDDLAPLPTQIPGLLLLPQLYQVGSTVPVRPGRKPRWARRLRHLDVDHVLVDLGAGTAPATLDLFLGADLGLCVATPDPPGVEATYRFLRAAFTRILRRALIKDPFKMRLVERTAQSLPPLPPPQDFVRALARWDTALGAMAARELSLFRPHLALNFARLRADAEVGASMSELAYRYLGVGMDYVGHVEQDDSVWLSVVRRRPLLVDSPTSKSARNLERIARRVLALVATREQVRAESPIALVPLEPTLYEVLGTPRGATDEELRRAYKRRREVFQPGSLPLTSLLDEERIRAAQARIEEAHDTLLDPLRRKAYDLSTFPEEDAASAVAPPLDGAVAAERALLRQELEREIDAETVFTGALLAKVRESLGIEIEQIAQRTKISASHLRSLEADDFAKLPALVYTRGFLQQVARHLGLDPTQVTKTYLRRLREWRAIAGEPPP